MTHSITRTIKLPALDDARRYKIELYWTDRGIDFFQFDDTTFRGKRGGIFRNMIATDSSKLKSELTIQWSRHSQPGTLHCALHVSTVFHDMTEWDKALLELEMKTFESFLIDDDRQIGLWNDFLDKYRAAYARWTVSMGVFGRKLPGDLKERLENRNR